MNGERVRAARESMAAAVEGLPAEERRRFDDALAISDSERAAYQRAQSGAFVSGRIDEAAARWLYRTIGEGGSAANGGWPAGVTTADKATATQAVAVLVGAAR